MKEIELHNRYGANLKLIETEEVVTPGIKVWTLDVDKPHDYIFKYGRIIFNENNYTDIEAIDPSGGPFLSVGDIFENKYQIVKINNVFNIWISERDNN